jgi:hypothetical protein
VGLSGIELVSTPQKRILPIFNLNLLRRRSLEDMKMDFRPNDHIDGSSSSTTNTPLGIPKKLKSRFYKIQ